MILSGKFKKDAQEKLDFSDLDKLADMVGFSGIEWPWMPDGSFRLLKFDEIETTFWIFREGTNVSYVMNSDLLQPSAKLLQLEMLEIHEMRDRVNDHIYGLHKVRSNGAVMCCDLGGPRRVSLWGNAQIVKATLMDAIGQVQQQIDNGVIEL